MEARYYNDFIRCYKNGKIERMRKNDKKKLWYELKIKPAGKYHQIGVDGKQIKWSRIISYCWGDLENVIGNYNHTNGVVDHINGDTNDNHIDNLRVVTHQKNMWNKKNIKGYSWKPTHNKWVAYIGFNKKLISLGGFNTEDEARNAYLKAKEIYHIM
jgi:hypothetical protein